MYCQFIGYLNNINKGNKMNYAIYTKDIKTNIVTYLKDITTKKNVYKDHSELANELKDAIHIVSNINVVGSLNTGKGDLYFQVVKGNVRYMCYRIESVLISHDVSMRRVCDLLITAFEGGSGDWLESVEYVGAQPRISAANWYDRPELLRKSRTAALFIAKFDNPRKEAVLSSVLFSLRQGVK